ncbi:MAG: hypothetical protein ABI609_11480 [Acidobacteriota bacterium]
MMLRRLPQVALMLILATAPRAWATSRDLAATVPLGDAQTIRLELPIGEIEVRGDGAGELRAELEVRCDPRRDCGQRLDGVHLDTHREGRELRFAVHGYPRLLRSAGMEVRGVVHVPASAALDIDMRIGELHLSELDLRNDVHIDMGVGKVRVALPEHRLRRVKLDSGIGDARLRTRSERLEASRSLLIGAKLDWRRGTGESTLAVDLGIGEVTVELD